MKFTLLGSAHFTQLPFLDFLQSFTENKKVDWSNRLCKIFECRQTNGRARSWCTIEILLSIHPLTFLVHLINDAKAFFFFDQVDVILFSVQKQNNLLHFVANSFFADIVIVFDIISYFPMSTKYSVQDFYLNLRVALRINTCAHVSFDQSILSPFLRISTQQRPDGSFSLYRNSYMTLLADCL